MASVYVSGFDYNTDDAVLRKHFSKVGEIEDLHFQSNGSAVVVYKKESAASRAVAELHETTMKDQSRYVAVKLDDPDRKGKGKGKGKSPKGKGKSKGGGGGGGGTSVYVSGFDYDTDEYALKKHFGKVGYIEDLHFQSNGSAVIVYGKSSAANRAVAELHETTMKDQYRYVAVKLDDPDRPSKGKGKGGKGKSPKGKGKGGGGGKSPKKSNGDAVYASGFDLSTDESNIKKHFGKVGTIKDLYFQSKGSCVITYDSVDTANRAVKELDGSTMEGQTRYVAVHIDARGSRKS